MNFSENFSPESNDSEINAMTMMGKSMDILWETVIKPAEENLDEDEQAIIGLIGVTLKMIAEKAYAYEKLMGEVPDEDKEENNPFSRN